MQDDHIADIMNVDQLWVSSTWAERFRLAPDPTNTGYGHTAQEVLSIRPKDSAVLMEYLDAVGDRTLRMLADIDESDLDRIVDATFTPPVTMGVRLISVAGDCLQHAGQAAYIRGMVAH